MTNENSFFVQILSDYLNNRETAACADLDWKEIKKYADCHQVSGIVYRQCKSFLPTEWAEEFGEKYASELFYYGNRVKLFNKIAARLSDEHIPFFVVKGLTVARLYPFPALRTMGDCDIIVHPEDRERTHEIMLELGFSVFLKEDKDWMYDKGNLRFEIHDHLLYDEIGNDKDGRRLVDHAWEYVRPTGNGTCGELEWSFHFLFLLLHLKKHLIHAGVGFRQFMDLSVVIQNCDLDWTWLTSQLEEQGLLRFARICFTLIERWFGISTPLEGAELDDEAYESATNKIFESGIFGHDDESAHDVTELNAIVRKNGPRLWVRLKLIITSIFPSYRSMRFSEYYAFLDNRPWLLPLAWFYRFYRAIRYRLGGNGARMIERSLISDERLDRREQELAKWGLR